MSSFIWPPTVRGTVAVVVAHAIAVTVISHCHYFVPPPTGQLWFFLEAGLAVLFWVPARVYVNRVLWSGYRATPPGQRWVFVGVPVALGFVVAQWWAGTFADTLWLHTARAQKILAVVLEAAHATVLATGYAGFLAALVLSDGFLGGGREPLPRGTEGEEPGSPTGPVSPSRSAPMSLPGWLVFGSLLGAANAFAAWYIMQERTAYYWDYMVYWTRASDFAEVIRGAPETAWDRFRMSVRNDDYGLTPAVLPALVEAVFGDSRLVYILALVNLYLAAVAAAGYWFVRRFAPGAPAALAVSVPAVLTFASPIAWAPLLHGYLDIGGVALAIIALALYLSRPPGGLRWRDVLVLAALLALLALFRRWYSFFIVAFVLLAGLESAAALAAGVARGEGRRAWRGLWAVGGVGGWFTILLVSFAAPWVARVLTTNYAADYAAYKTQEPFADRALEVVENCGPVFMVATLAALAVLVCSRATRRPAVFIAALYPIILTHFLRTQNLGPHHYYLLLPTYLLLPSLALTRVLGRVSPRLRWAGVAAAGAVSGVAVAVMFVPQVWKWREPLRPVVSGLGIPPLVRTDLPEFFRMLRYLDAETAATGGSVTLIGSSLTINGTMLYTADQSFREPLLPRSRVIITAEVDRVGGFPVGLFRAEVVAVAVPVQTHLRESEQQVVVIAVDSLLTRKDVGTAFDKLPAEFHLEKDVTIQVYRRTRPIAEADFRAFLARLEAAHPDVPAFFRPPGPDAYFTSWPPIALHDGHKETPAVQK